MKVAIISDIHDNLPNLKKCLHWCKENAIEKIICCGDVTNLETLNFLHENFIGEIILVRGNMEIYDESIITQENFPRFFYLGRCGQIEIDKKLIGVCHEPSFIEEVTAVGPCQIIFYGHTHKPWDSEKNGVRLVNPGTLGGVFQKACFGLWDTTKEEMELKILEIM